MKRVLSLLIVLILLLNGFVGTVFAEASEPAADRLSVLYIPLDDRPLSKLTC